MAVSTPGLSTLGIKFGYNVETTKGVRPSTFIWLERCNQIDGITLDTQTIDASALEDYVTKTIAGRQDTGATWNVTFNRTEEVDAQLEAMITAYNAGQATSVESGGPLATWYTVWAPNTSKSFYIVAQPPQKLPMPSFEQNGLQTITLGFAIQDYKGTDTAIEPTATGA